MDGSGALGSCYAFFDLNPRAHERIAEGVRAVVPYLRVAAMRLYRQKQQAVQHGSLIERERQLIELVAAGCSHPEIAQRWRRSAPTVRNLLYGLTRTLNVRSRAHLTAHAVQAGRVTARPVFVARGLTRRASPGDFFRSSRHISGRIYLTESETEMIGAAICVGTVVQLPPRGFMDRDSIN
jgi:DNA-binding CsgD family transcriptional regulator